MINAFYGIYHEALYRPLFNGLLFIYGALPFADLGISIIALTIAVRIIFFPATRAMFRGQTALQKLQPRIKAIQEQYRDKKDEQARRLMELYAEAKVNPFSGCLPLLIQLPILIALYQVFWKGIAPLRAELLYFFVSAPEQFHPFMFGVVDLTSAYPLLALFAGVSQFFQARFIPQMETPTPKSGRQGEPDLSKILSFQTRYFFPILIAAWSFSLPAALPLYWTTMNLFAIVEQILIRRYLK